MPTEAKNPIKIRVCEPSVGDLEIRYVTDAIRNNEVSSVAPPVAKFEKAFADKFGVKNAIAVNSGGSALFLVLKALGIKSGDEVIVPTFTMIATAAAVSHCDAIPIFIDTAPQSLNIDVERIEEKITAQTKAIIPVHIYGQPCEMDKILNLAKRYDLMVVEDAAEAHSAQYRERYVGTMGIAGCFSFYANKLMTTGEGVMITTNDDKLADKLKHWRGYNFDDEQHFWHKALAWNLRMSALEAALGLAQLERLDNLVEQRLANAEYYTKQLQTLREIVFFPAPPDTKSVSWMFPILAKNRDDLMIFLEKNGIETRTFFIPMHTQPVYKQKGKFVHSEHLAKYGLYLPSSSHLSQAEIDLVVSKIKEFYGR